MVYKGYRISKEYYVPYLRGKETHQWLVYKNGKGVWFDTLREAKEYVNRQMDKEIMNK